MNSVQFYKLLEENRKAEQRRNQGKTL